MGKDGKRKRCGWLRLGIPYKYTVTACIFFCTLVAYMERQGFSIAFTQLALTKDLNENVKGQVLSSFFYGYAFMQIPGGYLSSRYGGKNVLMVCFGVWGITSLLMPGNLDNGRLGFITFCRVIIGASQGLFIPASHTVLARWIPPQDRSHLVLLAMSGMYMGQTLSLVFFPHLVEDMGPVAEWRASGCMGLSWLLVWSLLAKDDFLNEAAYGSDEDGDTDVEGDLEIPRRRVTLPGGADEQPLMPSPFDREGSSYRSRPTSPPITQSKELNSLGLVPVGHLSLGDASQRKIPWMVMLRSLPVWAIVINNFGFHYATYVLMNWLPTYFENLHGVSLYEMSSMFKVVPYVMMFISSNVGGSLGKWVVTSKGLSVQRSRKLVNTLGFATAGISMLLMPLARGWREGLIYTTIALTALGLCRGGWSVNHMDIAPRHAGVLMALANGAGTCSGVVGTALTGHILHEAGGATSVAAWSRATGVVAFVCLISTLSFALLAKGEVLFP
ncbi:unnamed protein product [Choristocarpus tenellus]